jgi:hypothetical protein
MGGLKLVFLLPISPGIGRGVKAGILDLVQRAGNIERDFGLKEA